MLELFLNGASMELIKEIAERKIYKCGRAQKMFLFKCPVCKSEIARERYYGLKAKMCKKCADSSRQGVNSLGYKHGGKYTRLYSIWHAMKSRCYCKKTRTYNSYGGRGITMCDEWKNDFSAFREWALANGYKELDTELKYRLSIDRIDNNGNYEPANCRWITLSENVIKANLEKQAVIDEMVTKIEKIAQETGKTRKQICAELNYSYNSFAHAKTRRNKNERYI